MIEKAKRFEDIQIGDEITPLVKEIGMARMMAYGAATWDFIRLHYDADYARELGFESPFVDGQMMGGFLTQHVQDWAGPGAFLRKLAFRNRVMAYPGDSLTCHGVVTDVYLPKRVAWLSATFGWRTNGARRWSTRPARYFVSL
tara:strand:+ start:69 stop:497 length:429 start_codon:yes stop_codon:yes gene_type:complete